MIVGISDVDIARTINCYTMWRVQLAFFTAPRTPLCEELAVASKFLDPIIGYIHDVNVIRGVNGHSARKSELAVINTLGAPLCEELAVASKFLDSSVAGVS